jgi:hypothetical protein
MAFLLAVFAVVIRVLWSLFVALLGAFPVMLIFSVLHGTHGIAQLTYGPAYAIALGVTILVSLGTIDL